MSYTDDQLLDTCLNVTGHFEGGTPKYSAVTGNFDGMGLSAGIIQWNLGQGTLQQLLKTIAAHMGTTKADSFFTGPVITTLMNLQPAAAIQYAKAHLLDAGGVKLQPAAVVAWEKFLNDPQSVKDQRAYAQTTVLAHAKKLAAQFLPTEAGRSRVVAFFFDTVVQQGSMKNVVPATMFPTTEAMALAAQHSSNCHEQWESVLQNDTLAGRLMFYALERAKEGNPTYLWDTFSRRATIGCRVGVVHETNIDLTHLLD